MWEHQSKYIGTSEQICGNIRANIWVERTCYDARQHRLNPDEIADARIGKQPLCKRLRQERVRAQYNQGSLGAIQQIYREYVTNLVLGSRVVWGAIFIFNLNKSGAQKLRRIILLHLGLVILRFHFGKTRQVIVFMIVDFCFWMCPWLPKPIIFYFGDTKFLFERSTNKSINL